LLLTQSGHRTRPDEMAELFGGFKYGSASGALGHMLNLPLCI
jgi:hypothetical protein